MEAEEAVEAAGEGERWMASTNWIVSGGSLRDVISFETSEEDAPALTSSPLLLLRPPAAEHEFLPCEVTFRLSGKHELHRIYVRSTARVYEVYYAAAKQNNCTEYLCTVRCSVAAKDVTPVSSVVSADCESENYATLEKKDKISIADSNCSSEDGWVEVVPDSPSHDYKINALLREEDRNSNTDFQVHYEATADISDLSPCMSVTLRFLSLQTKTCVRISEIYIYADPVETPSPDNSVAMGEKYGGSSLLAMFMPSLLQLSKSAVSRQEKKLLVTSGVHEYQDDVQKEAEIANSGTEITVAGEESSDKTDLLPGLGYGRSQLKPECGSSGWNQSVCDQVADSCLAVRKLDQVHEQSRIKAENMQFCSSQKITEEEACSSKSVQEAEEKLENVPLTYSKKQSDPDQVSKLSAEEKYVTVDHIERVLDELVSRVTRIETFCSRFEESLLKPLNSIDARLQKLESVLDSFAAGDGLCRPGGCSKISGPHISADGSDSKNKDIKHSSSASRDDTVDDSSLPADVVECPSLAAGVTTSVPESRTYQGFVMKAPELIGDDSPLPADITGYPSLAAGVTTSDPESRTYQGFVMKAPEIISEDDEYLKNDSLASEMSYSKSKKLSDVDNEDDECTRNYSSLASDVNLVEGKKVSSIDSALASALEAFLTTNPRPNVMEPCEISTGDESSLNASVVGVICNETDSYVEIISEDDEYLKTDSLASEMSYGKSKKLSDVDNEDDECTRNYSSLASDVNLVEDKKVSSVDSALASALEAFLTTKPIPNVMEPCEIPTGDESSLNSSVVGVICNETHSYVETADGEQEVTSVCKSSVSAAAASKTCVGNYGKDSGCGISSILALDDSPAPLDAFCSSLTCDRNYDKDSVYAISGILEVSAALDDSSKPFTLISSLCSSLMDSALRLKAPDFPSNEDERNSCADTCHKDQSCMPMNGDRAPNLVASPFVSELNTSKCSSNLVDTSSGSYNLVKSATSPLVQVPCEVNGLHTENHVNKALVDFGLREFSKASSDKIKHCCSMEVLLEGSDDLPLECCPENREDNMKLHQCCSTSAVTEEERLLIDDMSCSLMYGLHRSGNKEPQVCSVNDSDHNKEEFDDPVLSRWSMSDLTDLHSGQAGIANGSSDAVMRSRTASQDNITLITNDSTCICDEFLGHKLEQTPKSATCSDDHLWEAKFVPQEDWTTGVPLETLLGETYDDRDQDSAIGK